MLLVMQVVETTIIDRVVGCNDGVADAAEVVHLAVDLKFVKL